jgi:phasin
MQEDVMSKESNTHFEIPADMRAFAEKSVEQAKQAFDIFISATQHAVNTAESQVANVQVGAREAGELALGFAERNIASSFEFAQKLLQAKEPQDVMALHTQYVNSQIATLSAQAKELSKRAAKMTGYDAQH